MIPGVPRRATSDHASNSTQSATRSARAVTTWLANESLAIDTSSGSPDTVSPWSTRYWPPCTAGRGHHHEPVAQAAHRGGVGVPEALLEEVGALLLARALSQHRLRPLAA